MEKGPTWEGLEGEKERKKCNQNTVSKKKNKKERILGVLVELQPVFANCSSLNFVVGFYYCFKISYMNFSTCLFLTLYVHFIMFIL